MGDSLLERLERNQWLVESFSQLTTLTETAFMADVRHLVTAARMLKARCRNRPPMERHDFALVPFLDALDAEKVKR